LDTIAAKDTDGAPTCRIVISNISDNKLQEDVLKERIKELNCLYGISSLFELQDISSDELFKRIVLLIPPAWQYPDITSASILVKGKTFATTRFRKTSWMQSCDVIVNGQPMGQVQVCYLEKRQARDEGPFLKEERNLLKTIAENISRVIEHREDIAALEKTRKKLEAMKISDDAAREYAEGMINTVREPLIVLDQDLRVVTASRSFYEFFKVIAEDTEGQLIYNLGNKQWDIPKLRDLLETILPQKATFDNYEVEHDFTTIGKRIMLLNARQIQRVLGKKRIILLAFEDITERKLAEEALRESKERFDQLAMHSGTITWEVDAQGLYTYVSYVSETVLGYRPDELVGRMHFYDLHPESEREAFKKAALAVFARKEEFVNMENAAQTKDGRQVWLSTNGIPLLNNDGTLQGYHGSDTDITEKRQREVHEIHSQKLESVGQLAAGIAHELNTPLQFIGDNITFMQGAFQDILSIISMLDVLPDIDSPQLPSAHELIDRIHNKGEDVDLAYLKKEIPKAIVQSLDGVQRASKIVQAMREFSHPGGEGMADLDINKSIESTITLSRNEWKYSAELIATLAPDLPTVQGYPADFNQVILNIILNAAQALQAKVGKGGPEKERIEIATRKDGNEVEICIRDTGPGIPPEIQSRVFDPFFTTKDVGKGTGQGLAIAHNIIVHKHGGKIYFETKLEEGTAFYIRLPLKTM
jgi:PAS domain S-box-containing protein